MDDLDLLIKRACEAVLDEEVKKWEEIEPIKTSERFNSKMEEMFPFLKKSKE